MFAFLPMSNKDSVISLQNDYIMLQQFCKKTSRKALNRTLCPCIETCCFLSETRDDCLLDK